MSNSFKQIAAGIALAFGSVAGA
ncbi:MAG: hypothetical protein RL654_2413, partial [Pseudomonadota bacterium]